MKRDLGLQPVESSALTVIRAYLCELWVSLPVAGRRTGESRIGDGVAPPSPALGCGLANADRRTYASATDTLNAAPRPTQQEQKGMARVPAVYLKLAF